MSDLGAIQQEGVASSAAVTMLIVEHPADLRGMRLPLDDHGSVLGRESDLVVPSATVSRRHARTWRRDGSLWIEDCGSSNGTSVNGARIDTAVRLRIGDRVTLGGVECRVAQGGQDTVGWQPPFGKLETNPAWPTQPMAASQTETTRYLCAATHLDETFCDRVIRNTVDQPLRASAPSLGVDIAVVARHALAARRRRLIRDLALLTLLLGALLARAVDLTGPAPAAVALVMCGLAVLVVAAEHSVTRFLLNGQLSMRRYRPNAIRAPMSRAARHRLARLATTDRGNVVIFRGFRPFVGSGDLISDWSFAVDISKGFRDPKTDERRQPKAFDAADLHGYLSMVLRDLELAGLNVTDRVFVSGADVWQDRRLLPDRHSAPVTSVPHAVVGQMLRSGDSVARPYLCAEGTGWRGQLVQTTFFRAVKLRGSLYVEGSAFVLLPLRNRFHAVDSLAPCGAGEVAVASLRHAAIWTVPLLLASPIRVLRAADAMTQASRTERRQRRIISNGWHFDYGAAASIREIAAGEQTRRYFLQADSDLFETVVQEMLVRGIVEFLSDHDIDIEQAAKFQQTINNGNVFHGNVDLGKSKNASISGSTTNNSKSTGKPGSGAH